MSRSSVAPASMHCIDNWLGNAMVGGVQTITYMKPAPPVIMIFFTSGRGVYLVLPVRIGASFHTPKSSKNLFVSGFECAGAVNQVSLNFQPFCAPRLGRSIMLTGNSIGCHDERTGGVLNELQMRPRGERYSCDTPKKQLLTKLKEKVGF
jgi:hypothetical protein